METDRPAATDEFTSIDEEEDLLEDEEADLTIEAVAEETDE